MPITQMDLDHHEANELNSIAHSQVVTARLMKRKLTVQQAVDKIVETGVAVVSSESGEPMSEGEIMEMEEELGLNEPQVRQTVEMDWLVFDITADDESTIESLKTHLRGAIDLAYHDASDMEYEPKNAIIALLNPIPQLKKIYTGVQILFRGLPAEKMKKLQRHISTEKIAENATRDIDETYPYLIRFSISPATSDHRNEKTS
jgi:hypothetical protein